jgi:hypothetical protein
MKKPEMPSTAALRRIDDAKRAALETKRAQGIIGALTGGITPSLEPMARLGATCALVELNPRGNPGTIESEGEAERAEPLRPRPTAKPA